MSEYSPPFSPRTDSGLSYNWPVVCGLFMLLAIPAIPAFVIIVPLVLGAAEASALTNALYLDSPLAVVVHGASGIVFFVTVPLQFAHGLRNRFPGWHRTSGKLALGSAYSMALSGIWMHHFLTPDELGMRYVGLIAMSLGICIAFSLAFYHVISGDIAAHRRWMCRALAVSLAVVTSALLEVFAALTLGQLDGLKTILADVLHSYSRFMALAINLMIVHWVLAKKRRAPQASLA